MPDDGERPRHVSGLRAHRRRHWQRKNRRRPALKLSRFDSLQGPRARAPAPRGLWRRPSTLLRAGSQVVRSRSGMRHADRGTPSPWSMKTMELQRRQHQNLRGIRTYRQNLEPEGLRMNGRVCMSAICQYYGIAMGQVKRFEMEMVRGFPEQE